MTTRGSDQPAAALIALPERMRCVTNDGGDGLWMECELCDAPIHRVRLNERGNGTGPWQEHREHLASSGHHLWRQEHNCQDPQPDDCTFCAQGESRG